MHQTVHSYANRAPNPGGNLGGIKHNRHRSNTHHESRFFFSSKKNPSPASLDATSKLQGSFGGNPGDLFVADFEAVKRGRAQMQKQKERELVLKEQREKVAARGGGGTPGSVAGTERGWEGYDPSPLETSTR